MGIQLRAYPNSAQRSVLDQWLGCTRVVWNAKCDEEKYLNTFARKYLPVGTFAPVNKTYAQFKNKELTPWLSDCPSKILSNVAANWHATYQGFMQGRSGKPRKKHHRDDGSLWLTEGLFEWKICEDGNVRLWIGTKKHSIGFLSVKRHRHFGAPRSIRIKRKQGKYFVSFCYDDGHAEPEEVPSEQRLQYLRELGRERLEASTVGIDRGVKRPFQVGDQVFDFSAAQKRAKLKLSRKAKKLQKKLARQPKRSTRQAPLNKARSQPSRRQRTRQRLGRTMEKVRNIRRDLCHQASCRVVQKSDLQVIVFEDLGTQRMTARPKVIEGPGGSYLPNRRRAKAGLNRVILDVGWHQFEMFVTYKAKRREIDVFRVSAHHTSQECADCSHTHPGNRETQERFLCVRCGHRDNADANAAQVIKKRAINLILDSGTELSPKGVLFGDTGRGAMGKTRRAKANRAPGREASKKKRTVASAA